jgi:hypothetical protein
MMRPPDAAADPIDRDQHHAPGDRNQAKPDRDRQPGARRVNGIRKLTHFRHLKIDPPGLVR